MEAKLQQIENNLKETQEAYKKALVEYLNTFTPLSNEDEEKILLKIEKLLTKLEKV